MVNDKATRKAINDRLKKLIRQKGSQEPLEISEHDNLIVFFSGHGFWDDSTNSTYLVPVDGKKGDETTFIDAGPFINNLLSNIQCRHLLLILDCCFAGAVSKETQDDLKNIRFDDKIPPSQPQQAVVFPNALKDVYSRKSRRILTAGWIEPVSDGKGHSPFARAFLECLSNSSDINQLALAEQIRPLVLGYGGGSPVSFTFGSANHQEGDYVFFRKDTGRPIPIKLREALLNLNFSEQRKESIDFSVPYLFNLIYLHGTERCGHHLFMHHFLKDKSQDFDLSATVPYYFRIDIHEGERAYKDLWELLSYKYCDAKSRLSERQVVETLLRKLDEGNCLVILKTGKRFNEDEPIEKKLYQFWVKFNEVLQLPDLVIPADLFNRFFLFVLDRRGQDAAFDRTQFHEHAGSEHSGALCFSTFQPVDRDKDLKGWVKNNAGKIGKAQKFLDIQNKLQSFEQKQFVEEAILLICKQCDRIECYDQIFLEKWKE